MKNSKPQGTPIDHEGRERIIAAATRTFAEFGYEGTTTAGVARAAGVTQPLVHHHFGSKEGLWRAAMDTLFAKVVVSTTIDPALPPREAMLQAVERFIRFTAENPELTRMISRESTTPNTRLTYIIEAYQRDHFRAFISAISVAQEHNIIQKSLNPKLLMFFVIGAVSHLFDVSSLAKESLGVDTKKPKTREEFIAMTLSILQRGVFLSPELVSE
jgi:TetR/AcrR family transcriptional regulator